MFNWESIIDDAKARLDWAAAQTDDPGRQAALLPMAGEGGTVEAAPPPASVRKERYRAVTRERMRRYLGQRKGNAWAGREQGDGTGVFNPADITPEQATALLVIVTRYVARYGFGILSPDRQDETVSRIIHAIWTRDYSRSGVTRGNLAGAVWQACALYRRTHWIGESVFARREARRKDEPCDGLAIPTGDNPAAIVAAMETAAGPGLRAPAVVNRARRLPRRGRGAVPMDAVPMDAAREALTAEHSARGRFNPPAAPAKGCPATPGDGTEFRGRPFDLTVEMSKALAKQQG